MSNRTAPQHESALGPEIGDAVARTRRRFGLPVMHIVVDRERRVEYLRSPTAPAPERLPSAA
jgi:hypothetical protein